MPQAAARKREIYRRKHPDARMYLGPLTLENLARHYRVNESTGCWEWALKARRRGYGEKLVGDQKKPAHVAVYELLRGPVPPGAMLRHTCDNRQCVNPDHLIPGSHGDNMRDARDRLRHRRGERQHLAKLTASSVDNMRRLRRLGRLTFTEIGRRFGVDKTTAKRAVRGETWQHLPDAVED